VRDEFNEAEFSPAHYDFRLVIDLIKDTIKKVQTNQRYVMIEGMCNSMKLKIEEDQLEVRLMDELMTIEQQIGEIVGMIGLQFGEMRYQMDMDELVYEEFV
jgi:hypothetical protein